MRNFGGKVIWKGLMSLSVDLLIMRCVFARTVSAIGNRIPD